MGHGDGPWVWRWERAKDSGSVREREREGRGGLRVRRFTGRAIPSRNFSRRVRLMAPRGITHAQDDSQRRFHSSPSPSPHPSTHLAPFLPARARALAIFSESFLENSAGGRFPPPPPPSQAVERKRVSNVFGENLRRARARARARKKGGERDHHSCIRFDERY